jgi:ABC-2 type transport system permease protein
VTILGAHVVVKLIFTSLSLGLLVLAGRQFFPGAINVNIPSFTAALLLSTVSILSLGFVIASIVPTARFAGPIAAAILYPMIAVSGLFFPVDQLPNPVRIVALGLPTTHAVSLMEGIWNGSGWGPSWGSVVALILVFLVCSAISTRVFRWE